MDDNVVASIVALWIVIIIIGVVLVFKGTAQYEDKSEECTVQGIEQFTKHVGKSISHRTKVFVDIDGTQHTLVARGWIDIEPGTVATLNYQIATYATGGTAAVNGKLVMEDKTVNLSSIE